MNKSVIIDLGNSKLAVRKSNFETVQFNFVGTVHSFSIKSTMYTRSIKNNVFFGFLESKNYTRQLNRYNNREIVTEKDWRLNEFNNFTSLTPAETGDILEGAYAEFTPSGKCKQIYLFPFTGIIPSSFNTLEYRDPSSAPTCKDFGGNSKPSGIFYEQFWNTDFLDLETGNIGRETELVGEIASILEEVGNNTAKAFQDFVLKGIDTGPFKFRITNGNFTKSELLDYKKALLIWLNLLKTNQIEISRLENDDKLLIYIDVMHRYNMLATLTVDQKIDLLTAIAKGNLRNWYFVAFTGFFHREMLAVIIIQSVSQTESTRFLRQLVSKKFYETKLSPSESLYKVLFRKIDDFFGEDDFTAFAKELNRLVLANNGVTQTPNPLIVNSGEELKELTKYSFIYNKRLTKDFKGEIDYTVSYPSDDMIKVKETVCTEIKYNTSTNTEYDPDPPAPYCSHREQNEVFLNHFDLVSVTFLSNPSFLDICEYENCSNLSFIASAGYIDYLIEKRSTKFTLDIFSRTLQVLSLAFGVAELLVAIRTSNFIRGVVGAYTVVGDAFALTIDSPAFYEYLQSAYPNDWQDYKETISMVSIIHGITATGANIGYSIYTVSQANRFIGEVEALQWNPAVMERMTASEVNLLQKTREKLIAELYALRKNLHTNQIIEEEIKFWRDYRNLGIPNAVRGNTQEWNLAKQTILDYRSIPVNNKGNYGYLEGSINGISLDTVIDPLSNNKIFGTAPLAVAEAEPQVFTALEVNWSRITDSEYRMLNKLTLTLEPNARHVDVAIDVFPNYTGTIKIISERAYCTSCQGAIKQFNRMFPNVNIILIDAVKL